MKPYHIRQPNRFCQRGHDMDLPDGVYTREVVRKGIKAKRRECAECTRQRMRKSYGAKNPRLSDRDRGLLNAPRHSVDHLLALVKFGYQCANLGRKWEEVASEYRRLRAV